MQTKFFSLVQAGPGRLPYNCCKTSLTKEYHRTPGIESVWRRPLSKAQVMHVFMSRIAC